MEHAGEEFKYKLLRSQETTEGAKIELPNLEDVNYEAILHYKRYQTMDLVTSVKFKLDDKKKALLKTFTEKEARIKKEAIQVAAMAIRIVNELT